MATSRHAQVSGEYIHFAFMYTTDHIFPILPIKNLVNQDGELTTPHKLATVAKPSVSNIRVLLFLFGVKNSTAHVDTKALNLIHQSQKFFCGIFIGTPQHKKGYLIYVHITRKIVSSHDVVFDEIFSGTSAYMARPY